MDYTLAFKPRPGAMWWHNASATTAWNIGWVMYPVAPSGNVPTFTRMDQYSVGVTNGVEGDQISFSPASPYAAAANMLINPAVAGGSVGTINAGNVIFK